MLRFKAYLEEAKKVSKNTHGADINEILLGYYCLGNGKGSWTGYFKQGEVKKQLNIKKEMVGEEEYMMRSQQSKVMADESLKWAKANGFKGRVKKVWWTARKGDLERATGMKVKSEENPTDTLIQFTNGEFLGLSAKSTKGKGDIGFKNPGIGSIDKALGINLKAIVTKRELDFAKKHKLSTVSSTRKKEIRKSKKLEEAANAERTKTLKALRDGLYKKLTSMSQKDLRAHLSQYWMDVGAPGPKYIKVTGKGNKPPFTATVMDPDDDPKTRAVKTKKLKVEKVGNDAIGIMAGNKKIMKARAKYESQAMASSMKYSGEPW